MLVNGSDFYCGNSSGSPCQFALKNQIPSAYVHPSTKQCNYSVDLSGYAKSSELNSLKSSVSSGKSLVASAVTGKGVSTAADASFQTIANNINAIQSPPNSSWYNTLMGLYPGGAMLVANSQHFSIVESPDSITYSGYTLKMDYIDAMGGNVDYATIYSYRGSRDKMWGIGINGNYDATTNILTIKKPSTSNCPFSSGDAIPYIGSDGCLYIKYPLVASQACVITGVQYVLVKGDQTSCPIGVIYTRNGAISSAAWLPWNSIIIQTG